MDYIGYTTLSSTKITQTTGIDSVKRDLLNAFSCRKGERRGNPGYGTTIYDMVFELNKPSNQELILKDAERILQTEPRVSVDKLKLNIYTYGCEVDAMLTYIGTGQTFNFTVAFNNSLNQG